MGPVTLDIRVLIARASQALLRRLQGISPPLLHEQRSETTHLEGAREDCAVASDWENVVLARDEDLGQIVRVYDCHSQAHRQVNAAVDALHELLVEIEEALASPVTGQPTAPPDEIPQPRPVQILRPAA